MAGFSYLVTSGLGTSSAILVGRVIFKDNFHDPKSGWDVGSDAIATDGYHGGAYFIKIKKPHASKGVLAPFHLRLKDVAIEVTAQNVTKRSDTFFGLLCRARGSGTRVLGYSFGVYDDGRYAINRADPSRTVTLIQANSPKIPHRSSSYKVAASCIGTELVLFVDGKRIGSARDTRYRGGDFGLRAGTDSRAHGVREARFMNFIARKP